mmetsp:Transcript_7740/g.17691  ORF Transcript_7740/g.17691 Transcript_7740/m.17691 type:complete len:149 (-) Transcript_7740:282-728(-)
MVDKVLKESLASQDWREGGEGKDQQAPVDIEDLQGRRLSAHEVRRDTWVRWDFKDLWACLGCEDLLVKKVTWDCEDNEGTLDIRDSPEYKEYPAEEESLECQDREAWTASSVRTECPDPLEYQELSVYKETMDWLVRWGLSERPGTLV